MSVAPIVCTGHSRPIVDVRFRHTKGDNLDLFVTACHDKTAQLRWADNGAWIGTYKGHDGAVWSTAIDESGLKVLTGSADFSAKLWDATTGEELATFAHQHVVKAVDFSPNTDRFLTAGLEKKAHVYDLATRNRVSTFEHPSQVSKALWLDENIFVTGGYDSVLRIWDSRSPSTSPSSQLSIGSTSKKGIADIQTVPEQDSLVTCLGRTVIIFDMKSHRPRLEFPVKFDVEAASMSSNGKRLVAGGSDLWLHVFNLESTGSADEISVHKGHHGPIFCVRWDTNCQSFASGSEDGTVRIWPVTSI